MRLVGLRVYLHFKGLERACQSKCFSEIIIRSVVRNISEKDTRLIFTRLIIEHLVVLVHCFKLSLLFHQVHLLLLSELLLICHVCVVVGFRLVLHLLIVLCHMLVRVESHYYL